MSEEVILDITTVDETVTIDTTAPDVVQINVLAVTGGATTWDQIEGKPTEFPPAAHTQGWSTLTGTVDIVPFTTTNGGPTATGELAWLASTESLALRLANGENLDIGEENVYHVENNTASTITKGTAVSYAGTVGGSGKIRVKPWNGSTDAPEAFMGFAMGAIATGEAGYVTAFGVIRGVNTSTFSDGVILYANPSGTGLTATKPTTTHVIACLCVNASNNGTILVRPTVDKITDWDDVTGKPTEFTPAPHTHGNITNDGRIGTTADLVTVTGTGGVLTTASRSGIDSRTSFPNADVAAATENPTAGTIVKRSVDNVVGLYAVELSGLGGIFGVGNSVQVSLQGSNSTIETQLGNSPIQTLDPTSNIITRGSFVLNGGTNTITLSGSPTANRTITVPDASGALALISTAGQNFLNSPTSANLATLLTDENGTGGGFVRAEGATLTSPSLVGPVNLTSQDASTADRVMTRALADARYLLAQSLTNTHRFTFGMGQGVSASGGTAFASRGYYQLFTSTTANSASRVWFETPALISLSYDRRMTIRTRVNPQTLRAGLSFFCQIGRWSGSSTYAQLNRRGFGYSISGSTISPFVHNGTSLNTTLSSGAPFSLLTYPWIIMDFIPASRLDVYGVATTGGDPVLLATINTGLPSGAVSPADDIFEFIKVDSGSGGANDWTYITDASITVI